MRFYARWRRQKCSRQRSLLLLLHFRLQPRLEGLVEVLLLLERADIRIVHGEPEIINQGVFLLQNLLIEIKVGSFL